MPRYFELKISLKYIKPTIWRTLMIHEDAKFMDLHIAIQDAFNWEQAHLFEFCTPGRSRQSLAALDMDDSPDPRTTALKDVLGKEKTAKILYIYDFGDNWEHTISLVRVVETEEVFWRKLLKGKRNGPLEDCGSIPGYERLVEIFKTGQDPWGDDLKHTKAWMGDWDPEAFDLETQKASFDTAYHPSLAPSSLPDDAPAKAHDVTQLIKKGMKRRKWPADRQKEALELWFSYYRADAPRIRKAQVYAAAIEYCMALLNHVDLTQTDLAEIYDTTAISISKTYRKIWDACDLDSSHRQSSTHREVKHRAPSLTSPQDIAKILTEQLGLSPQEAQTFQNIIPPSVDVNFMLPLLETLKNAVEMEHADDEDAADEDAALRQNEYQHPPLPEDAHTWPLIECRVPNNDIWKATGCGSLIISRQRPDGLCSTFSVYLDASQGVLYDYILAEPLSLEETRKMLDEEIIPLAPPSKQGDEALAARFLWGAFAYVGESMEGLDANGAFHLLKPPTGDENDWEDDFIFNLSAPQFFEALELCEENGIAPWELFTRVTLRLKNPSKFLKKVRKKAQNILPDGEKFSPIENNEAPGRHFMWTTTPTVPETNLMTRVEPEFQGLFTLHKKDLLISTENPQNAATLMHHLRNFCEEWRLTRAEWKEP